MLADETLKHLLQLCADTQDGFWEAATNAKEECLPALFQEFAVQWNEFSDQVFPILLAINHTSPDRRWKADPERAWMNPQRENSHMDDLAICMQCLLGLNLAQAKLAEALQVPLIAGLVTGQIAASKEQAAAIRDHISGQDHDIV